MPKCVKIQKPLRKVCSGDMRDKITIQVRAIKPPVDGVDFSEVFNQDKTLWSMLETKSGVEIFDGTNLKGVATHYFYIRYICNFTAEKWLKFKEEYYDILDVQNLDGRNEFLLLRCALRGTTTNPANYA